jgi:heat shock protein HslJ
MLFERFLNSKVVHQMWGKICKFAFVILVPAILIFLAASSFAADYDGALFFFHGGKLRVLERVSSGSVERYETPGDPSTALEIRGRVSTLAVDGRKYSRYVLIRDFGEDEFALTVDGENFLMKSAVSASGAKYEAEGDPDTVFWSKGASVSLTVRGEEYAEYNIWQPSGIIWLTGEAFPTGIEWKVKSVSDAEILKDSNVTVEFLDDGALHGMASVNTYRSSWLASGGRLLISHPTAATLKMGPPNLMEQENMYLDALSNVMGYRLRHDGVTLLAKDSREIELTF